MSYENYSTWNQEYTNEYLLDMYDDKWLDDDARSQHSHLEEHYKMFPEDEWTNPLDDIQDDIQDDYIEDDPGYGYLANYQVYGQGERRGSI